MLQSVTETNPTEPKSSKPKSNLVPHHILNVFSLYIQYKVYRTRPYKLQFRHADGISKIKYNVEHFIHIV